MSGWQACRMICQSLFIDFIRFNTMATTNFKHRILSILVAFAAVFGLMSTLSSCATLTPEQKVAKAAQKELEARQNAAEHARVVEAFKNLDFVLEADRLIFKYGDIAHVSSSINFISVIDGMATVQLGSYRGMGANGVGGITVEGKASDVKFKSNKNGVEELSMHVNGTGISAIVTITLYGDTNQANAVVQPNLNSNKITLSGIIRPAAESTVYKGSAL